MKPGRNDPCSCGSGKKFKHCCEGKAAARPAASAAPSPDELNQLVTLYQSRRYAELESRALALVGRFPASGFAWKLLGAAQQMQGKNALDAFRKTAELLPNEADAHFNLGVAQKSLGMFNEAAASYRRALKLNPKYAEAYDNLGNVLKELGQLEQAAESFRQALKIKPNAAISRNNLGTTLKDLGKLDEAAASYRQAIALNPGYAEAHINLGNVLRELGSLNEAAASCRKALEIDPNNAIAHGNLGNILMDLAQYDAALAGFEKALQLDPNAEMSMMGIARLGMVNGNKADAEANIRRVLALNPGNIAARLLLAKITRASEDDDNFTTLVGIEQEAKKNPARLTHPQRVSLNFALGKCYEDLKKYELAFPHFIEGCRLKRETIHYDAAHMSRGFDEIIRFFDTETIDRLRGAANPAALPIFVMGMPRSGTTLTEQIIASHPDVFGAGELPDLMDILNREAGGVKGYPNNLQKLDLPTLSVWAADYIAGLKMRAPDALRVSDKQLNNFLAIGLIHAMFPNAKIIHVNRNPVDTCLSCFTNLFSETINFSYNLEELGRYYVDYARLMDHWRTVLPEGAFLDVQYEEVVADQEQQARRIIDFCGLEWNDACIDFHKLKRSVITASVNQVRQPIYKTSIERWRKYETHLGPLLNALGNLVPNGVERN